MVFSGDAARAFDLSQEPASVRDRYGRHQWGQSHLLARRLAENGVAAVGGIPASLDREGLLGWQPYCSYD
jgi:hypothetical protein